MSTSRFNQDPGVNYGKCNDCGVVLPTEREANDHMATTFEESKASTKNGFGSGHAVRIVNPARPARIKREISSLIEDAIQGALSRIDDLIAADHITEEEAADALQFQHTDFTEEWQEYSS